MKSSEEIFARYQGVGQTLPKNVLQSGTVEIGSLMDIAPRMEAFVFDAFGVLNVGETPISGAVERIAKLREMGIAVRVLTNAASYDQDASVRKFERLGFDFTAQEIVTSRSAALAVLDDRHWGVIAADEDELSDITQPKSRVGDSAQSFSDAEGFLFLSTAQWSVEQQKMLEKTLQEKPRRVVIANADLAAPRGQSFSIEPGFWGHQIADRTAVKVEFFGKPFQSVFDLAQATLAGVDKDKIAMCGDSLHTDVLGANAVGWQSVFVTRDGLFNDLDTTALIEVSTICPNWHCARI